MNDSPKFAGLDDPYDGAVDIGPVDPDVALTADYLAGEASAEQIAEFERRFVEDDAFHAKVSPAIQVWTMPVSFRELMDRLPVETATSRRPMATDAVHSRPARLSALRASPSGAASIVPAESRHERLGRYANRVATIVQVAAAIVVLVVAPIMYFAVLRPGKAKVIDQANAVVRKLNAPDSTQRSAGIIPGGRGRAPAPQPKPAPPETSAPRAPVGEVDALKPVLAAMGQEFRTGADETKLVELENGTRILVRPNSTLFYRRPFGVVRALPMPEPMKRMFALAAAIAIEGEVAIEVPDEHNIMVMLASDAGMATLSSGSFGARCAKGCGMLEFTVGDGHARLRNMLDSASFLDVEKGQHAIAPRVEAPLRVDDSAASRFPAPDPSIRKKP